MGGPSGSGISSAAREPARISARGRGSVWAAWLGHRDEPRLEPGEFLSADDVLNHDTFRAFALGDV